MNFFFLYLNHLLRAVAVESLLMSGCGKSTNSAQHGWEGTCAKFGTWKPKNWPRIW